MSTLTCENLVLISQTTLEKFKFDQNSLITLYNQRYILEDHLYKIYLWLYRVNGKFWLISNYSKVVWDINTKFSPINVPISYQLFTNFEVTSYIQNGFTAKTILSFSRAWQAYFLSHSHQTPQIFYFFADLQIILLSFLGISNCFKNTKNAGAFLSRYSDLLDLCKIWQNMKLDFFQNFHFELYFWLLNSNFVLTMSSFKVHYDDVVQNIRE